MDEPTLFDRFHDALDIEPPAGAYEHLRHALTSQPVAVQPRPAFRMRLSKMAFRMAAGLTAAAIVIALIAAFLVAHNRLVGSVPAQNDQNVKAYRAMITADYSAMDAATSGHCGTITDTACAAAVQPVNAALQRWYDDMDRFPQIPMAYASIDQVLRAHLKDTIADLDAAVAFQKAGDEAGFTLAMNSALYERAWIDPASSVIEGSYPKLITSYHDTINQARSSVTKCLGSTPGPTDLDCHRLQGHETCGGAQRVQCESDAEAEQTMIETFLTAMVQNPAPSAQSDGYMKLQLDLVHADAALLAIHDALMRDYALGVDDGESAFVNAMMAADSELAGLA